MGFAIGCSFSFEEALIEDGIEVRHIACGCNVPMYRTNVDCVPAGVFHGKLVVSMRPMKPADAIRAMQITSRFPSVHGAPVHIGLPELIGIKDIAKPDYGDAVPVGADELPVFWACGVTPQSVIASAKPAVLHHPRAGQHADHRSAQHQARRAVTAWICRYGRSPIEAVIHQDVGRNIAPMFVATRGGLRGAVMALADTRGTVGLITGFYVPAGTPPAAETDGPIAIALLARGLRHVGLACRVCTDAPCASACRAALAAAGVAEVPVDVVPLGGSVATSSRCGARRMCGMRSPSSGAAVPRMARRGTCVATTSVPQRRCWTICSLPGPWDTIAVGDGGNEIGMGSLARDVIAANIAFGETIACVTPATHLILAGVSHWGAYALLGGLAAVRTDWREALLACLDPALDQAVLEATVRDGPAVDGVTRQQTMTIDTFVMARHHQVLAEVRRLLLA